MCDFHSYFVFLQYDIAPKDNIWILPPPVSSPLCCHCYTQWHILKKSTLWRYKHTNVHVPVNMNLINSLRDLKWTLPINGFLCLCICSTSSFKLYIHKFPFCLQLFLIFKYSSVVSTGGFTPTDKWYARCFSLNARWIWVCMTAIHRWHLHGFVHTLSSTLILTHWCFSWKFHRSLRILSL